MARVNKIHTNQALDTSVVCRGALIFLLCGFDRSDGIAAARARLEDTGQITQGTAGSFLTNRRVEIKTGRSPEGTCFSQIKSVTWIRAIH